MYGLFHASDNSVCHGAEESKGEKLHIRQWLFRSFPLNVDLYSSGLVYLHLLDLYFRTHCDIFVRIE